MNKNLKIRLLADSEMTLALLLLMSYQLVGEKPMSGSAWQCFVSHRAPCSEQKMDGKHYKGKIYGAQNLADCDRNIAGSDDDRLHGERYSVVQLYFPVRPDQRGGQSGKEHPYSLCILGISVYGGASGTSLEHDVQNSGKGVSIERRR